eukprot:TRINITY_DN2000_c0_g1_i1.p1 TRINITY_DN2000_c0_g1~~TRINITY_DN2000_c0_g1_i1.p1  ORF type:complete len:342 (+),score=-4.92 TRINITY_DN2000_c0_g1_i1:254-1279(+)
MNQRIKRFLPKIISPNQKGFMHGRHIEDCPRSIQDAIDHCMAHRVNYATLMVDFEKAFDTLSHKFILEQLYGYGFSDNFVKMISSILRNASSRIQLPGGQETFHLHRGARQGDLLSPTLFIIAVNGLLERLSSDGEIQGITTGSTTLKSSMFADDLTLCMSGSLSFGINIVGPPIPFYIAIGALTNQAIRRSLIDTRSPGPSAIVKRRRENTDSRQKWLRYRLATSSLFLSKSRANPEDQVCHWCKEVKETSFHFFYFCQKILPVIRAVEEEIVRAYGTTLEPSDWLISTSPRYGKAFHIEHIISSVQGLLYACRVNGRCIPAGIRKYVVQSIETLRSATT